MEFIVGLPKTSKDFDSIWAIVDHLTKIANFLPVKVLYLVATYAKLYIDRILSLDGVPKTIILIEVRSLSPTSGSSYTNHSIRNSSVVLLITLRPDVILRGSTRLLRIC